MRYTKGIHYVQTYTNDSKGFSDATVIELYVSAQLLAKVVVPWKVNFDQRSLFLGPWDLARIFSGDANLIPRPLSGRESDERPVVYRRPTTIDPRQRPLRLDDYDAMYFDEFRIWSRALQEDELDTVSRIPLAGNEPDLMVYYNFDSADPYVEVNRATAYSGVLSGVHVQDTMLTTSDGTASRGSTYDPHNDLRMRPFDTVCHAYWPVRGNFPKVPESLFPVFEKSMLTGKHGKDSLRPGPFRVNQRGIGSSGADKPPATLTGHSMTTVDNLVYIFGGRSEPEDSLYDFTSGMSDVGSLNTFWIYNTSSQTWLPKLNISSVMAPVADFVFHEAVLIGKKIYVLGADILKITLIILDTETRQASMYQKSEWSADAAISFGVTQKCTVVSGKICTLILPLFFVIFAC